MSSTEERRLLDLHAGWLISCVLINALVWMYSVTQQPQQLLSLFHSFQSASHNSTSEQFEHLQQTSPSLEQNFLQAYTLIRDSEALYQPAATQVTAALNNLPSRLSAVQEALDRYEAAVASVMDDYLKELAGEVRVSINHTLSSTQLMATGAAQVCVYICGDVCTHVLYTYSIRRKSFDFL